MTFCFIEEIFEGYVLHVEQDKFSTAYRVTASPLISEGVAGYPETSIPYGTIQEAKKRLAYLKRKIKRDGYACSR